MSGTNHWTMLKPPFRGLCLGMNVRIRYEIYDISPPIIWAFETEYWRHFKARSCVGIVEGNGGYLYPFSKECATQRGHKIYNSCGRKNDEAQLH